MIYLVRHGQSVWNLVRRTQGQTSHPGLTDRGRAQARAAGRAIAADLGSTPVSQVICSDLDRAVQTGKIVAIEWGAKVTTDARFREQGLGRFEGLPDDELLAAAAGLDLSDPDLRLGGGESVREVAERMAEAWASLPVDAPVVVVSHGDAIRVLLGVLAGHPPGFAPRIEVGNGAVAVIDTTNSARWLTTELR